MQVELSGPLINLSFVLSNLVQYVHNQFSSSSLLRSGVDLSQMYNIKVHNNAKHSK